jgi:hypothetical protein
LYSEEELPAEFKLYLPVQQNKSHGTSGGVGVGSASAIGEDGLGGRTDNSAAVTAAD